MRELFVYMIWPEYMIELVKKEVNYTMDDHEELNAMIDNNLKNSISDIIWT